jgi:O6-methylguanine-DNA--protein-cysteine methyltransferase
MRRMIGYRRSNVEPGCLWAPRTCQWSEAITAAGDLVRGGLSMVEHIAVGTLDTAIGVLWMACSERGVCKLVLPHEGAKTALDRWLALHAPAHEPTSTSTLLEQVTAELREYFAGSRRDFTLPLDFRGSSFHRRVWLALTTIPYGRTVSYGALARTLGTPQAARAVGAACGANPVPIIAP